MAQNIIVLDTNIRKKYDDQKKKVNENCADIEKSENHTYRKNRK